MTATETQKVMQDAYDQRQLDKLHAQYYRKLRECVSIDFAVNGKEYHLIGCNYDPARLDRAIEELLKEE